MNIVLTGFMATGKTEISKAISEISKYNLVDTDDMIVEQEGITINEIFDKCGEEYFRKTECEVIKKAAESRTALKTSKKDLTTENRFMITAITKSMLYTAVLRVRMLWKY